MNPSLPIPAVLSQVYEQNLKAQTKDPSWLKDLRSSAFARSSELGIPSTRHEEWRYTSLRNLQNLPALGLEVERQQENTATAALKTGTKLTTESTIEIVFRDGRLLHLPSSLPAGLKISDLSSIGKNVEQQTTVKAFLEEVETLAAKAPTKGTLDVKEQTWVHDDIFSSLGNAFFERGLFIQVATRAVINQPIHIRHIHIKDELSFLSTKVLVRVENEAQVCIVESIELDQAPKQPSLRIIETDCLVAENARLRHGCINNPNSLSTTVYRSRYLQKRHSNVSTLAIADGGQTSRHHLGAALLEEGAEISMHGLSLVADGNLVDHHTSVDHLAPHTRSNQLYRAVLTGKGRSVFNGKVFVRNSAPGSSAFQTNKNLLLSDEAEVDTKPQLEIDTDDVQCSHGATVGQVNASELFYLKSRGISENLAKLLLAQGFAREALGDEWAPIIASVVEIKLATLVGGGAGL